MKKQKAARALICLLLAAVLLLGLIAPALAAETTGETVPVAATVPETTSPPETEPATEPAELPTEAATEPPLETAQTLPPEPEVLAAPDMGWNFYFGLLHAHTNLSDGTGSVEEAFQTASEAEGLDFFAVTDHSNSFDNADRATLAGAVSESWAAGKAAAKAVTGEDFVGIFGFELTWPESRGLGHINTFGTEGFLSRENVTGLKDYYAALAAAPGAVGQFNHPGTFYGDFESFAHYDRDWDDRMALLEVGSEGGYRAYGAYTKALDKGWHVAPTSSHNEHSGEWGQGAARTVILADSLTESSLLAAMRSRRVYATDDSDLKIYYTLNGHVMGSVLRIAGSPEIQVWLEDPTDEALGKVEVISQGGRVLASETAVSNPASLTLKVGGGYRYYYLRITQPDGDVAVTAPVWVEPYKDLGIRDFSTDDQAVPDREMELSLTLYNKEGAEFSLDTLDLYENGERIYHQDNPGEVSTGETLTLTLPYTPARLGQVELRVCVSGYIGGFPKTYEAGLTLSVQPPALVRGLLVDGSHGNESTASLTRLKALAKEAGMEFEISTGIYPKGVDLLVVTAPDWDFSEDFLVYARELVAAGGTLIVCGRSREADPEAARRLNILLETVGATLRLRADTVRDEVNNGGSPVLSTGSVFNREEKLWDGLYEDQVFLRGESCTVDPGRGTWLVKGSGSDVLLAWEENGSQGRIFAAGCAFLTDENLPEPLSQWESVSANQTLLARLLALPEETVPLTQIAQVRKGQLGQVYRVCGFVTAGTGNPYNTFPQTLYLQDETGGMALIPFTEGEVQIGTGLEVIGVRVLRDGEPVLEPIRWRRTEELYNHLGKGLSCQEAGDYEAFGGLLVEIQGEVTALTKTADGKGISALTVQDIRGDEARVRIEEGIFDGATGKNTLAKEIKKGRVVRVLGIVSLDEEGQPVIRVRNCAEVVYVPPIPDPTNPKTGDGWWWRFLPTFS